MNGKDSKQKFLVGDIVKHKMELHIVTKVWYSEGDVLYQVRPLGDPIFLAANQVFEPEYMSPEVKRVEINGQV